jgi:hypothetical protein
MPQLRQAVEPRQYWLLRQQPPWPKLCEQGWFQQPPMQMPVASPGVWEQCASEQQSPSWKQSLIELPAAGEQCVEQLHDTIGGSPTFGPGSAVTWRKGALAQHPWSQSQGAAMQAPL